MKRILAILLLSLLIAVPVLARSSLTVGIEQNSRDQWESIVASFEDKTGIDVTLHPFPENTLAQQGVIATTTRAGKLNLVMLKRDWARSLQFYLADLSQYEEQLVEAGASMMYVGNKPVGVGIPFASDWFMAVISWPDERQNAVQFLAAITGQEETPYIDLPSVSKASPLAMIESFATAKIDVTKHNPKIDGSIETLLQAVESTVGGIVSNVMSRLPSQAQTALSKLAEMKGVPFSSATSVSYTHLTLPTN